MCVLTTLKNLEYNGTEEIGLVTPTLYRSKSIYCSSAPGDIREYLRQDVLLISELEARASFTNMA